MHRSSSAFPDVFAAWVRLQCMGELWLSTSCSSPKAITPLQSATYAGPHGLHVQIKKVDVQRNCAFFPPSQANEFLRIFLDLHQVPEHLGRQISEETETSAASAGAQPHSFLPVAAISHCEHVKAAGDEALAKPFRTSCFAAAPRSRAFQPFLPLAIHQRKRQNNPDVTAEQV